MAEGRVSPNTERWHQTLRTVRREIALRFPIRLTLLENDFLPGDPEAQIVAFVGHYNHRRYPESLKT